MSDQILVTGSTVAAISPEGIRAEVSLPEFLTALTPPSLQTGDLILPDGVRAVFQLGQLLVVVLEISAGIRELMWIAEDSPDPYGPLSTYLRRRLAFPPMLAFGVFAMCGGQWLMTRRSELFFASRSLAALGNDSANPLDDPALLKMPALLNCSRYGRAGHFDRASIAVPGKSLSWFCVMNWSDRMVINQDPDPARRISRAMSGLIEYLFASPYNYSSEFHPMAQASGEQCSWFTETVRVARDPRLASVAAWEAASAEDPAFVLKPDAPWIPTGYSVREVADRILTMYQPKRPPLRNAADLARVVFNRRTVSRGRADFPYSMF